MVKRSSIICMKELENSYVLISVKKTDGKKKKDGSSFADLSITDDKVNLALTLNETQSARIWATQINGHFLAPRSQSKSPSVGPLMHAEFLSATWPGSAPVIGATGPCESLARAQLFSHPSATRAEPAGSFKNTHTA